MAVSRSFKMGRFLGEAIADGVIESDGGLSEAAVTASGGGAGGVTTYTAISNLPTSGNSAGDLAFVDSSDNLFIYSGAGWYSVSLINATPSIVSILDSDGGGPPFVLSTAGASTVITVTATDSDGIPLTFAASADSDFGGLATISQSANVFTVTPFSQDSATTTSGTVTFSATDGIATATSAATSFELQFSIVNSQYTTFLLKSDGNNGDNITFTDQSSTGHSITRNGSMRQEAYTPHHPAGYSYYFDGSGDYLTTDFPALGTGDFTIEFWINPSTIDSNNKALMDTRTSNTNNPLVWIKNTNVIYYYANSGDRIVGTTTLAEDTWYHVALCRSSGTSKLFLNGTQEGSDYSDSTSYTADTLFIGQRYTSPALNYHGHLADFRIVSGTAVYTSTFTPPTSRLTAISGTELLLCHKPYLKDESSNNANIAWNGNVKAVPWTPFAQDAQYSPSTHGGSIYFDGTTDWFSIPDSTEHELGAGASNDWTIEFWMNVESIPRDNYGEDYNAVMGKWNGSPSKQWFVAQYSNRIVFGYSSTGSDTAGSVAFYWPGNTNFPYGTWVHVAIVNNGGTVKGYINGLLSANTLDVSSVTFLANGAELQIGRHQTDSNVIFDGYLADIRIVNGTAVYTAAFTPPTSPLTAVTNTTFLLNGNEASMYDAKGRASLLQSGGAVSSTTETKFATSSTYFDGTNDYIIWQNYGQDHHYLKDRDFTIEAWVYFSSTGLHETIYNHGWNLSNNRSILFGYYNTTELALYASSNGSSWDIANNVAITSGFSTGVWTHIAVTREGSNFKTFHNGTQVSSFTSSSSLYSSTWYHYLGRTETGGTAYFFNGYIEDFRITVGLARYTSSFTPPTSSFQG